MRQDTRWTENVKLVRANAPSINGNYSNKNSDSKHFTSFHPKFITLGWCDTLSLLLYLGHCFNYKGIPLSFSDTQTRLTVFFSHHSSVAVVLLLQKDEHICFMGIRGHKLLHISEDTFDFKLSSE